MNHYVVRGQHDMTVGQQDKIWTKNFISISLTQLLFFTVFYTLLTTLPIYVIDDLGGSESQAGLVVTFMLISAITVRPFSAKVIDLVGKKKVLVISVTFFLAMTASYLLASNFVILSAIRFMHGISFGFMTTITGVIVADILPANRRGEGMGYFAMAMNIAVVAGPFIGLLLIQHVSFQTLFLFLIVLMVISLFAALLVKIEEGPGQENMTLTIKWSDLFEVSVLPITVIIALVGFSYGSILSFVPVYAETIGLAKVSSYFFLVFAIIMIAFRPYLGRAFDEKGARFVLIPSLIIFSAGLALLSVAQTVAIFLIAGGIIGLGYGSILPGFQALVVQHAGPKRTSQAMSTLFTLYDTGIALGAFTWGIISATHGFTTMYLVSALVVAVTVVYFHLYSRKTS